jgi:ferredoxin
MPRTIRYPEEKGFFGLFVPNQKNLPASMPPNPKITPVPLARLSAARSGGRALWRKLHRWFGAGAAIFLLIVSGTGIALQWQSIFGGDEAEKERQAKQTSPFLLTTALDTMSAQLATAQAAVRAEVGSAPLDRVLWLLKGDHPTLTFFVGGHPARRFVVNAGTGVVERRTSGDEESWILRLHSGELIGDGGKLLGLFWGSALLFLTVSGVVIYWQMLRRSTSPPAADGTTATPAASVTFRRSDKTAALAADQCILEAAEAVGVKIESDCRAGTCGTCKVKLLSGAVTMAIEDALSADEKAGGVILACQAKSTADCTVDA